MRTSKLYTSSKIPRFSTDLLSTEYIGTQRHRKDGETGSALAKRNLSTPRNTKELLTRRLLNRISSSISKVRESELASLRRRRSVQVRREECRSLERRRGELEGEYV